MTLMYARRRAFDRFAGKSRKLSCEVDVTLPLNGEPPTFRHEWSLSDLVGAKLRMLFNAHAARSCELDPDKTEAEKNVALLVACSELAHVAKWPFYVHLRLARIILALEALSKGFRDPMLEPKNLVSGRYAPAVTRWRIYCVIALQAKSRLVAMKPYEATKAFLKELEQAIEIDSSSPQWRILFPLRGRTKVFDEEKRRCASIREWSKQRSVQGLKEPVLKEFEVWSRNILNCSESDREEAYSFALSLAVLQAKSLLGSRG
jgi:hypothetical protein